MSRGRIVLLLTSPRVAPGLLTWPAWQQLHAADETYIGDRAHPQLAALDAAGVRPTVLEGHVARRLFDAAERGGTVVWISGTDGDPGLGEELARLLYDAARPPELEILPGSYDLPGARFVDLVQVMDRLRRECPWVQQQTHRTLVRYLVEEAYETVDAIESGDRTHLREELGDLLFQVVFHARLAEESDEAAWSIDDVAADLVEKLIRRNPHVFGEGTAADVVEIENVWDQLKSEEKRRTSALEGVPMDLPALGLADKVLERVAKQGLAVRPPAVESAAESAEPPEPDEVGDTLLALVASARRSGIDPEQALRDAIRRFAAQVRAVEAGSSDRVDDRQEGSS